MGQDEGLLNEYFEWMYHLICNDKYYNKVSYKKLLSFLFNIEFIPLMDMDDNRRYDGLDFRYRFGYENGYSIDYIKEHLDKYNCSILEMMVALAFRVEEQITSEESFGNRTGQWFWNMVVNLGLNHMTDDNFDLNYCEKIIDRFNKRKYKFDGHGGLFVLKNPIEDLRNVDIWCQFMWYLNENIYDTDILM